MLEAALFQKHLEDDEHVSMIVHTHWLLGVKTLIAPSLSLLLALAVLSGAQVPVAFYVSLTWAVLSVVWWAGNFFNYYLDAWIITNQGVIDLEWRGWFHRQSSRILYSDIQGVSYEIKGIFGTLLRFGTLSMEKISTGAAISLAHVPHPRSVEALILQNMERYLHKKNMKDSRHVQELLATLVAEQVQLNGVSKKRGPDAKPDGEAEPVAAAPKKRGFRSSAIDGRSNRS